MAEQLRDDLDRDPVAQHPGREAVAAPVRVEVDAGAASQPQHEVVHGRVGERVATRLGEEVDEHVVRIEVSIFGVQVVPVEADQLRAHRDRPLQVGLRPGAIVVRPRHDGDRPLRDGDVLVAKAEGFADPDAAVVKEGEEEAVPQMGARVQDRLHLADSEDSRQLHRRLERDRPCWRRQ